MKLGAARGALEDKDFRWFFTSRLVSTLGSMMTPLALAFAVLHVDNSAVALSKVLAAYSISQIVFLLVGGVVADRLPRTLVLQSSFLLTALTQGVVAGLLLTGTAQIWLIMVLEGINGAVSAFTMPAMQGLIPQLVRPEYLQQANALLSSVRNGATILGPVLAGVLVATVGAGWALAIDAFSFVVASLTLMKVALPPMPGGDSSAARPGMVQDLREGWGEFSSRTWLWVIVAAFGVTNAIHAGAWGVLGPVIAKNNASLGISGWGFVMSAEAVGMFAMALVLMKLNLRRPLRYGMIGVSLMLIPLTMLGVHPVTLAMVPAAFISGLGMETFGTGWNVAMMEQVPQEALSRVSSYDMLGSFVAVPVGTLFFGWIVTRASPETVLVTSGLTYAVVSLGTLLVPSVRNLRRLDDSPAKRESITE